MNTSGPVPSTPPNRGAADIRSCRYPLVARRGGAAERRYHRGFARSIYSRIRQRRFLNIWDFVVGRFIGLSAGSHPKGAVHPVALSLSTQLDFPTEGLHSKSWDEFAAAEGTQIERSFAFRQAFRVLETRIKLLLGLLIASIDKMRLQKRMDAIGRTSPEGSPG